MPYLTGSLDFWACSFRSKRDWLIKTIVYHSIGQSTSHSGPSTVVQARWSFHLSSFSSSQFWVRESGQWVVQGLADCAPGSA